MGRKEYEQAVKIVHEFRAQHASDPRSDEIAELIEESFVKLFDHFDTAHRFDIARFATACRKVQ